MNAEYERPDEETEDNAQRRAERESEHERHGDEDPVAPTEAEPAAPVEEGSTDA